ncbi:MAG: glycosyltransferase [Anaerolineae bacterium]|nr:glycosyltransferase [Anaerolineae bacterium]
MVWPKISVIVPARPGIAVQALAALQTAAYPPEQVEVLVVEGDRPSRQRNVAARHAGGDVLYFLDDDSLVAPDTLRRLAVHYHASGAAVVGGPSLTHSDEPLLSRCIGYALGTHLGAWTMRARYAPVGRCRPATEKELIGCNLSVDRDVFWAVGGFREDLFPNEETELVNRLWRCGYTAIYDPELVVKRAQRRSLAALARQFFSYGQGRMRQIARTFPHSRLAFLAPAVGLFYVALVPVLWKGLGPQALLPAAVYLALALSVSIYLGAIHQAVACAAILPFLFGVIHVSYGCGLIYGAIVQLAQIAKRTFGTDQPSQVVTRIPEATPAEK